MSLGTQLPDRDPDFRSLVLAALLLAAVLVAAWFVRAEM
jgi:hypothetical protein